MPNAENKQNYDSGANDAESHKIVAQYLIHLRTLTIVRHILPTVIASQQHRGAALALLEGDTTYESKVGMLEE